MVDAVEPGRLGVPGEPDDTEALPGGNVLALMAAALVAGWERGEWATYKQWASVGAQVRKGERGTGCVFWNVTQDRKTVEDDETGEAVELMSFPRFRARAFTVFNAAQVDGYIPPPVVLNTEEQITHADAFLARVGAHVEHRGEGRAYYSPARDLIVLPAFEAFTDASAYYATSAHEHAHWTGHVSRLNRDLANRSGDDAYAAEELVAELSAAFTCATLGISTTPRPDHAAYLAHWLERAARRPSGPVHRRQQSPSRHRSPLRPRRRAPRGSVLPAVTMTTFKITHVYDDEIVAEAEGDERLRGFWWSWCPRVLPDGIGVYGSTAVMFASIHDNEVDLTPDALVEALTEHYQESAHVDALIAAWCERISDTPSELDELIEDEQGGWPP